MARDIDMSDPDGWDDDDKLYLAARGELPEDVMSIPDQRKMLDLSKGEFSLEQLGNTGTVETLTTEALEAELERRRSSDPAQDEKFDPRTLFSKEGKDGARRTQAEEEEGNDGEDEGDRVTGDYDDYNKATLSAELDARNKERESDEDYEALPLSGSKAELVARLEKDDAAQEEDE